MFIIRIRKSVIVADALFLHFSRPAEQNTAFPMIRSNTYPIRLAPSGIGALAGGDMKVNVLGTEYTVTTKKYDEDEAFERLKIVGYWRWPYQTDRFVRHEHLQRLGA